LVHPNACIGSRVDIGEGTLVQAGCVLTCDIQVGDFVVLNVGVRLSHDVRVEDFATLAPGACLAGAVHCEELAEIGMGTWVIPGRTVGSNCTTGAGTVVIRDVPPAITVVGVPSHPIHTQSRRQA
jgi:acetyltransferase-like isoleucine patch superfamily enzyme